MRDKQRDKKNFLSTVYLPWVRTLAPKLNIPKQKIKNIKIAEWCTQKNAFKKSLKKNVLAWREVVVDDVVRDVPDQNHLEAGQAVVAEGAAYEDSVFLAKLFDLDAVVKHDRPEGEGHSWRLKNNYFSGESKYWESSDFWTGIQSHFLTNCSKNYVNIYFC